MRSFTRVLRFGGRVLKGGALLLFLGGAATAIPAAVKSAQKQREYLTLPDEFYLDLDLENVQIVERSRWSPREVSSRG